MNAVSALELTAATLAAGAGWCAWAWFWPWTFCRRCTGRKGQGAGATKWGWSRCRRCGGTGEQARHTARAIAKLTGHPIRGTKEK